MTAATAALLTAAAVRHVFGHVDRLSLEAHQAAILYDDLALANAAVELRAIAEQLAAIAVRLDPRLDPDAWSVYRAMMREGQQP